MSTNKIPIGMLSVIYVIVKFTKFNTHKHFIVHFNGQILLRSQTLLVCILQDFLIDILRKSRQWYIRCILPQPPYKLPGALMHHLAEMEDGLEVPVMGHIDIPLVRAQIRRGNIVKAARIFKQGESVCLYSGR